MSQHNHAEEQITPGCPGCEADFGKPEPLGTCEARHSHDGTIPHVAQSHCMRLGWRESPQAEGSRCPMCGSDERDMPNVGTMTMGMGWLNDSECGTETCPHVWHKAQPPAGEPPRLDHWPEAQKFAEDMRNYNFEPSLEVDKDQQKGRGVPAGTAREFWQTFPHCIGYPSCDGDLEGTSHEPGCPLFGKKEITALEFAEAFAAQKVREARQQFYEHYEQTITKLRQERDALREQIGQFNDTLNQTLASWEQERDSAEHNMQLAQSANEARERAESALGEARRIFEQYVSDFDNRKPHPSVDDYEVRQWLAALKSKD